MTTSASLFAQNQCVEQTSPHMWHWDCTNSPAAKQISVDIFTCGSWSIAQRMRDSQVAECPWRVHIVSQPDLDNSALHQSLVEQTSQTGQDFRSESLAALHTLTWNSSAPTLLMEFRRCGSLIAQRMRLSQVSLWSSVVQFVLQPKLVTVVVVIVVDVSVVDVVVDVSVVSVIVLTVLVVFVTDVPVEVLVDGQPRL